MALKNVRNICAHHSRLWNVHIVAPFTKRIGRDQHLAPFVECLERQPSFNYTTTFTALSLCAYCMGIIRPESKWKERCRTLLKTATPFILRGMGAPADWETLLSSFAAWEHLPIGKRLRCGDSHTPPFLRRAKPTDSRTTHFMASHGQMQRP